MKNLILALAIVASYGCDSTFETNPSTLPDSSVDLAPMIRFDIGSVKSTFAEWDEDSATIKYSFYINNFEDEPTSEMVNNPYNISNPTKNDYYLYIDVRKEGYDNNYITTVRDSAWDNVDSNPSDFKIALMDAYFMGYYDFYDEGTETRYVTPEVNGSHLSGTTTNGKETYYALKFSGELQSSGGSPDELWGHLHFDTHLSGSGDYPEPTGELHQTGASTLYAVTEHNEEFGDCPSGCAAPNTRIHTNGLEAGEYEIYAYLNYQNNSYHINSSKQKPSIAQFEILIYEYTWEVDFDPVYYGGAYGDNEEVKSSAHGICTNIMGHDGAADFTIAYGHWEDYFYWNGTSWVARNGVMDYIYTVSCIEIANTTFKNGYHYSESSGA